MINYIETRDVIFLQEKYEEYKEEMKLVYKNQKGDRGLTPDYPVLSFDEYIKSRAVFAFFAEKFLKDNEISDIETMYYEWLFRIDRQI